MRGAADRLLIAACALAFLLPGLGDTPLLDRDESRFAEAARDMRARGDAVVPQFNGEPRYQKPILTYWLLWGSFGLLGPVELAARLPSALAGAALALLIHELGRSLFSRRAGLLAAGLTLSSPLAWFESRLGTADAAMTAALVGVFLCLVRMRTGRRPGWWAASAGGALGTAVLAKGPVALCVVGLAALASAGLSRLGEKSAGPAPGAARAKTMLAGVGSFLAVVLPWTIAASLRTEGGFLREGLLYHFLGRAVKSYEGHRMFPGAHTLLLVLTCFPWSFLIPAALVRLWAAARRSDPRAVFLLGWVAGPLLLFEASASRLPHYVLPIVPALALAVASLLDGRSPTETEEAEPGPPRALWRAPALALLGVAAPVATAAGVAAWRGPVFLTRLLPGADSLGPALAFLTEASPPSLTRLWAGLAAMAAGGAVGLAAGPRPRAAVLAALSGWCLCLLLLGTLVIPTLPPLQLSRSLAVIVAGRPERKPTDRALLITYREPSLVFYLRRDLFAGPGQVVEASPERAASLLAGETRRAGWVVASADDLGLVRSATGLELPPVGRVASLSLQRGKLIEILVARVEPPPD